MRTDSNCTGGQPSIADRDEAGAPAALMPDPASFQPAAVRYIKLGAGGAWEKECLADGTLCWGIGTDPHAQAAAGDWDAVRAAYQAGGLSPATITGFIREARDFYTSGSDTLWITFAQGHLWWAFAEPGVDYRGANAAVGRAHAYRRVVGQWRNTDLAGKPLATADLSTSLTQVSAYQQTICSVGAQAYLLQQIRGDVDPACAAAEDARQRLADAVLPLMQRLHQNDFEVFTDLLFAAMGWRRTSALGGTMKAIDLLVAHPATGERAAIQVKSSASQATINACAAAFRNGLPGDSFYIVTHTAKGRLSIPEDKHDMRRIQILDGPALSTAAVANGLTDWLIQRAA